MKRMFAIVMLLAVLSGCSASETVTKPNEMPNQQPEATAPTVTLPKPGSSWLSCKNGEYFLTLPQSGETLELSDAEVRFVPYITDTLVAEAECKILEQTAEYGESSGFYLQITEGYLCLAMEVIKDLTPPEPTGTEAGNVLTGCGIDHEHVFYSERISAQPAKDETGSPVEKTTSGVVYKTSINKIQALSALLWGSYDNGDGTYTETDHLGIRGLLTGEVLLDIPELLTYSNENIETLVPVNGQITRVYLLEMNAGEDYPMTETTWENLEALMPGEYHIVAEVQLNGNCDPDAPQNSFCYEDLFCLIVQEEHNRGDETEIRLLQYTWDGWGIATKTVGDCDAANRIRDALDAMQETGETAPKISDDTLQLGGGQYPVDRGTMWIEWEDRIWRLNPESVQLCLVQTHLGEGRILEMPEGFLKDVNNAWRYAPYDYYRATYRNGEKTVNLENVYQASTTVAMCVKDIHVESSHDPHNTITLELTSTVDQTVELKLSCQQSDDNLTWGDDEILELKKDVPKTVELEFGGWKDARYWICMEAANTKAEIIIEP